MTPMAFISYRRSDSPQAALALDYQLRSRLGPKSVFLDRSGMSAGDTWAKRIVGALEQCTVLLLVIGPGWLKAADEYGRRRLDISDDWVRNELLHTIQAEKKVIPLLVAPQASVPPAEALPRELQPLLDYQAYTLRDDHWDGDLNELVRLLVANYEFKEFGQQVRLPQPEVKIKPLSEPELWSELATMPGWEPVESFMPGDYPKSRQELRKVFTFKTFPAAIGFMKAAVDPIKAFQHHPRWENQWRTVTVYLSTWDIGFRISPLDMQVAKALDEIYRLELANLTARSLSATL